MEESARRRNAGSEADAEESKRAREQERTTHIFLNMLHRLISERDHFEPVRVMLLLLSVGEIKELDTVWSRRVRCCRLGVKVDHETINVRLLHIAVRKRDDDAPVGVNGAFCAVVEVDHVAPVAEPSLFFPIGMPSLHVGGKGRNTSGARRRERGLRERRGDM